MTESITIVKSSDLSETDKAKVLEITEKLFPTLKTKPSELSNAIKTSLDEELGAPWHIIVGKSFASSISHEQNGFIYFYIDNFAFLCFKTA